MEYECILWSIHFRERRPIYSVFEHCEKEFLCLSNRIWRCVMKNKRNINFGGEIVDLIRSLENYSGHRERVIAPRPRFICRKLHSISVWLKVASISQSAGNILHWVLRISQSEYSIDYVELCEYSQLIECNCVVQLNRFEVEAKEIASK